MGLGAAGAPGEASLGSLISAPPCAIQIPSCSTCAMKRKKKKKPGNYCPTAQAARKTVKNLDAQTVNYPQSVTLIYSETP